MIVDIDKTFEGKGTIDSGEDGIVYREEERGNAEIKNLESTRGMTHHRGTNEDVKVEGFGKGKKKSRSHSPCFELSNKKEEKLLLCDVQIPANDKDSLRILEIMMEIEKNRRKKGKKKVIESSFRKDIGGTSLPVLSSTSRNLARIKEMVGVLGGSDDGEQEGRFKESILRKVKRVHRNFRRDLDRVEVAQNNQNQTKDILMLRKNDRTDKKILGKVFGLDNAIVAHDMKLKELQKKVKKIKSVSRIQNTLMEEKSRLSQLAVRSTRGVNEQSSINFPVSKSKPIIVKSLIKMTEAKREQIEKSTLTHDAQSIRSKLDPTRHDHSNIHRNSHLSETPKPIISHRLIARLQSNLAEEVSRLDQIQEETKNERLKIGMLDLILDTEYKKTVNDTKIYTKLNIRNFILCCEDINMLEALRSKSPVAEVVPL